MNGDGIIDSKLAMTALEMMEVDELGLDPADRHLLSVIMEHHNGGPVGVETLAALTSEERSTIEDFYEPYLMQIGLLERTPRGRKVTVRAWKHLGKSPINSTQPSLL
jgi:Holliday junction DNA helicase RuvB